MKYDFSGYATKNDLLCSDGRVIRRDAFKEDDGQTVPLVWQHVHDDPMNVLGHAVLENRSDGVYAYCSFNDTAQGQQGKSLVQHGDISALSIYANRLQQQGQNVIHGKIREVSLVLAGANPGAMIDNLSFAHADGSSFTCDDEAVIYTGELISIAHADDEAENKPKAEEKKPSDKTVGEIWNTFTEDQKNAIYIIIAGAQGELEEAKHSDDEDPALEHADDGPTVQEVFDSLTDEQKDAAFIIIGAALSSDDEEESDEEEDVEHSDMEGTFMKKNIFDATDNTPELEHAEVMAAFDDAPRYGSLKQAFLEHGITAIGELFPEAKTVTPTPDYISRQMDWVSVVLNSVHKSPFSRIRSTTANITADEARAKGYVKGTQKVEEQLSLLSRTTTPQTIYKLQKLDRDDIIDITDLDVVQWLKGEMRMMLNEEIARAALVGDGRIPTASDKIKTDCVRPIYGDSDTYVIYYDVPEATQTLTAADQLVDAALNARVEYRGSGNLTFFATAQVINSMLTARDRMGRRLYETRDALAAALGVSRIVEVPVLAGLTRTSGSGTTEDPTVNHELKAIMVNLADYTFGADKGGEVSLFDDFDIDYNKYTYLIETRMSGALTHPYSAICLEAVTE